MPPQGCAILPISKDCEVYLMLKGFIDISKELDRLESKKEKLNGFVSKLKSAMEAADYIEKVPEEVKTANSERLQQLQGELNKVIEATQALSLIKE
mgnify:FL=1